MGKRGNGEGSITRRKNGDWCAQYVVYTSEGRKRKTLYGNTRQEVATKLARVLSDQCVLRLPQPELVADHNKCGLDLHARGA